MTMSEKALLTLFGDLRENGMTKMYEQYQRLFISGIVSTSTHPINYETFIDEVSSVDVYELPDEMRKFLTDVVRGGDNLRYHRIIIDDIMIHYVFINNNELGDRVPGFDHPAAVSNIMINAEYVEPKKSDNDTQVQPTSFREYAAIVVGDKSPDINDKTRNHIVKHEFAHVIIKYITSVVDNQLLLRNKENLTDNEIKDFIEFLCDFIQFDNMTINKYTTNPISDFADSMEDLFKPDVIEKYNNYLKEISEFYTMFE